MGRAIGASAALILCLLLAACGGDGLLLFPGQAAAPDLSIVAPEDGTTVTGGKPLSIQVQGPESTSSRELVVEVSLLSASGQAVVQNRFEAPDLNEDINVALPELPPGEYRLEVSLLRGGEQIQKRTTTLFAAKELPQISGITSFPPVILASSKVLLKAELAIPAGSSPYLRWSWRGKTIGRGTAASGAAELLWKAPAEQGVYTVTLEVFPVAPASGGDFAFRSPISMSTDVYVSGAGRQQGVELGPAASYWSLFHLQANLEDTGVGARGAAKREATPVGSPQVVPAADGFAYRLDGSSGFTVPRMVLPVENGRLAPFTVSVGLQVDRIAEGNRILEATSGEGLDRFSFLLDLDAAGSPEARLTVPGREPVVLASGAGALLPGRRALLSISFIPGRDQSEARWFIDGKQVSSAFVPIVVPTVRDQGSSVVGGDHGLVGSIDEIGVYYRDPQGRPAPDPTLFAVCSRLAYGDQLLAAEGFDGLYLAPEIAVGQAAVLSAGSLVLPAGSALDLPAIQPQDGCTITFTLGPQSSRTGLVQLAWEATDAPFLQARVAAESDSLTLSVVGETVTAVTPEGKRSWPLAKPPVEGSGLLVRLAAPSDASAPLSIAEVLALRSREKE